MFIEKHCLNIFIINVFLKKKHFVLSVNSHKIRLLGDFTHDDSVIFRCGVGINILRDNNVKHLNFMEIPPIKHG